MAVFLTPNTKFKPFSYQEMLAPVLAYKEAYDSLEAEMNNLDVIAGDVDNKLTEKDTELKNIYKTYKEDLNNALSDFYQNGYTSDAKKKLAQLKSRYSKEINPINEAYKSYQEDQKQLITLKRTHPEMIIEGIGNSVSDYMYGNTPNGITANTEDIYNKSMKAAAGTSSRFSELVEPTSETSDNNEKTETSDLQTEDTQSKETQVSTKTETTIPTRPTQKPDESNPDSKPGIKPTNKPQSSETEPTEKPSDNPETPGIEPSEPIIPSEEIEFIHNADTDSKKATLFKNVRSGNVRVLLGSTSKMGAGTNVQDRLVALHHIDVPWRPSDVEQRERKNFKTGKYE